MSRMYTATIDVAIPVETLDASTVYRRLQSLLATLATINDAFQGWVEYSRGDGPVKFSDEARFIEMLAFNAEQDREEYPTLPTAGGAEANITTAATRSEWEKPGRTTIVYTPWSGRLTLSLNAPIEAFGELECPRVVRACVAAVAEAVDAIFIGTNVKCPLLGGKGYDTYATKHRLFPHRRWLGWMGFVPHLVPHKRIPEAAATEVVTGKGTVIVAVDECLDLRNPEHLKRVHQVELRMANVGLLDVTDTSLLE